MTTYEISSPTPYSVAVVLPELFARQMHSIDFIRYRNPTSVSTQQLLDVWTDAETVSSGDVVLIATTDQPWALSLLSDLAYEMLETETRPNIRQATQAAIRWLDEATRRVRDLRRSIQQ